MHAIQNDYFSKIDVTIDEIKRNFNNPVVTTNKIIEVLEGKISELRDFLINHKFNSQEEEIYFFKEQKPRLVAKLIYYKLTLEIESNMPLIRKDKIDFIEMMLNEISLYTKRNKNFYQYYRSNATHDDAKYFTRSKDGKLSIYDTYIINYDIRFCTSHDYNVAQFIANEMIVSYLERKLELVNNPNLPNHNEVSSNLKWTGNRIELVELIYSLHTQNSINNGNTDIKELANSFGKIFNIEIEEHIYRYYIDIKNRKTAQTKFLNFLSDGLINRFKNEDL